MLKILFYRLFPAPRDLHTFALVILMEILHKFDRCRGIIRPRVLSDGRKKFREIINPKSGAWKVFIGRSGTRESIIPRERADILQRIADRSLLFRIECARR